MDFHSVMETFAEAWVAANTHTPLTVAAEQGLINGPNGPTNHTQPSRALPAHSTSSHSPPGHTVPSHPPAAHSNSTNGPANLETPNHDLCVPAPNHDLRVPAPNHDLRVPTPNHDLRVSTPNHDLRVPTPNHPLNPPNQSPVHQPQPVICTIQDVSSDRRETECSSEGENCRIPDRSSEDSPTSTSNLSEIKSSFVTLSKPHGKSLPVHCIVEQIPGPQACGQHVELDSYAIVPCDTLFNDLVRTALGKLGYSTSQILGAKGSIQIKKWKPLAFDQITENPEATVADILGELSTVATLHVRLYSVPDDPREWKDITVRNAVLELLREMSQSKLAKLCPLSQPMLSNIINNRYMGKIGKEKCQEFGLWYLNYRKQNPEGSTLEIVPSDRPADGRLTFHPLKELPIMRDWFHSCRNPSRRTLQMYVDILNQGPVRQQERPKVALATLKNWWKNEKQRERKHLRGDEKVDDPEKPKKRKKNNSTDSKDRVNECPTADSHSELKSKEFTLINHSENESDTEKSDKKDCDGADATSLPSNSSPLVSVPISPEASKTASNVSIISFSDTSGDTNKFVQKDIIIDDNSRLNCNILHSPKASVDSSMFHKIPVGVCLDHSNSLFPFSDPHLSVHNCSKIYCDNNSIERTNITDSNSNHVSSEEDVDDDNPFRAAMSLILLRLTS